jgi:hypothetical protein
MIDLENLEKLARAANDKFKGPYDVRVTILGDVSYEIQDFMFNLNPTTILELIERLRKAEAVVEAARQYTIGNDSLEYRWLKLLQAIEQYGALEGK